MFQTGRKILNRISEQHPNKQNWLSYEQNGQTKKLQERNTSTYCCNVANSPKSIVKKLASAVFPHFFITHIDTQKICRKVMEY